MNFLIELLLFLRNEGSRFKIESTISMRSSCRHMKLCSPRGLWHRAPPNKITVKKKSQDTGERMWTCRITVEAGLELLERCP